MKTIPFGEVSELRLHADGSLNIIEGGHCIALTSSMVKELQGILNETFPVSFGLIKAERLHPSILDSILQGMGWEEGEDKQRYLDKLKYLTVSEAYELYLNYNGIIHWTSTLTTALDNIRASSID